MTKRVAFYLRVSTNGQTTDNQRRELEEVAERSGWKVVEVYEDAGLSGAKGRDKRPAFDKMLRDATARQFDLIAAWSVDRLGRSLQDLLAFLSEIHALGVDLYLHRQAVDTTTPAGRALFSMMGVFAEFEREIIRERINAGLARAKGRTKEQMETLGKQAIGRPSKHEGWRDKVLNLREDGKSIRAIASECGLAPNTVRAILRDSK